MEIWVAHYIHENKQTSFELYVDELSALKVAANAILHLMHDAGYSDTNNDLHLLYAEGYKKYSDASIVALRALLEVYNDCVYNFENKCKVQVNVFSKKLRDSNRQVVNFVLAVKELPCYSCGRKNYTDAINCWCCGCKNPTEGVK